MEQLIQNILFLGQGLALTLELLIGGLFIGMIFGIIVSIFQYNKIANFITE